MLSVGHPGLACEPVVPGIFLRKERWEIACAVEDANHLDAVLYWTIKDVRVNRAGQEVAVQRKAHWPGAVLSAVPIVSRLNRLLPVQCSEKLPMVQGMVNTIAEQAKQKRQARRQQEDWATAPGRT